MRQIASGNRQTLLAGAKYHVGGYVKLDAIFDFDDVGDRFQFDPRTFPVTARRGEQTTIHARQTRLNLSVELPTSSGAH